MYYYAVLNEDNICTDIYAMPVQISGDQIVEVPSKDQSLIGQRYNRTGLYFEPLYYYAVLNEKNIVTETVYRETQEQPTDTFRAITFTQYQTITGLYWNGTDYVTPPISIAALASTDEVNYKDQDKWLSTKLDEIEADISANEANISTLSTDLSTVASSFTTISQSLATLNTAVEGKANAVHTHDVSDVTGLVTTLDGFSADIGDLETAVNGKANTNHSHAISDVTGLQTALDGKSPVHTHNYLPTTGGTVNGNLNVNGIVRVNSQQCLFDSGSMVTLSTNNRETMIAGSKIYSKVAISTSSDARLKENVQPAPVDDLINMIKGLEIKKFNYVGNTEKNIGVIAQDFMYNNPTYISEFFIRQCCDDGMYSFKDTELVYALAAAVQDIYSRLENNN